MSRRLLIALSLIAVVYVAGLLTAYQGAWVGWSRAIAWTEERDAAGRVVNSYETPDRWDATQQFYTLSTCRKWAESGPLQFGGRSRIEYTCSPYKQLPRAR
jgi:hypothetical protein